MKRALCLTLLALLLACAPLNALAETTGYEFMQSMLVQIIGKCQVSALQEHIDDDVVRMSFDEDKGIMIMLGNKSDGVSQASLWTADQVDLFNMFLSCCQMWDFLHENMGEPYTLSLEFVSGGETVFTVKTEPEATSLFNTMMMLQNFQ